MSKELIERLRKFIGGELGNGAADALEETALRADALAAELEATKTERDSWERQASDRLDDVLKVAAERDALRLVCGEAYQMAGALNAPTKALDNLLAASTGAPLPHESFLPAEAPQIDREKVRDAIAKALGDMIYCCTRVWEAWNVGTMSQGDFVLASEDDGILDELTAAAVSAIEAKPGSAS